MSVTKLLFRTVGVMIVLTIGLTARGQETSSLSIASGETKEAADTQSQASLLAIPDSATESDDRPVPAPALAPDKPAQEKVELVNDTKVELVTERYPNGSIKIERQVTEDAKGNYVNHGSYKKYDLDGKVVMEGEFLSGKQHGKWIQTLAKDNGHLFSSALDGEFAGPFVSEASFIDGELQGTWSIRDHNKKSVIEWNFDHGTRNGQSTWWYANGQKRLEATYENGQLTGEVLEWNRDGKQVAKSTYIGGRILDRTVGWYTLGQKRFEGYYLRVQDMAEPAYDWWTSSVASISNSPAGKDQKHGVWIEWYPSGNKKIEAQYDHDMPVGKFTWWYENGQKEAEGEYLAGKQSGTWITWHPNGLKESQAEYQDSQLVSKWMHWDTDGKLVEVRDPSSVRAQATTSNSYHRPTTTTTGQRPVQNTRSR